MSQGSTSTGQPHVIGPEVLSDALWRERVNESRTMCALPPRRQAEEAEWDQVDHDLLARQRRLSSCSPPPPISFGDGFDVLHDVLPGLLGSGRMVR